jgi:hypothetical protein
LKHYSASDFAQAQKSEPAKQGASVAEYQIKWVYIFFSYSLALTLACLAIIYWLEKK